jgi:hypothetical protein
MRDSGRPTGQLEGIVISRHLLARVAGVAVILLVLVVGLGAGYLMPDRVTGAVASPDVPATTIPSLHSTGEPVAPSASSGANRYLAPGGSDAAAGTIDAPWATLGAAAPRLRPGDTLWVRGGHYAAAEVDWTAAGTASDPITVRGYPGERAVFDGAGSEDRFLWLHGGAAWLVLRDFVVTGFATWHTGVISVSDGAHDLALEGLEIDGNRAGTTQDHLVYLAAPDVHDVTIQDCLLAGVSGAAIHVYHEPAPTSIRIIGNRISDAHWGVLLYSGVSDVLVSGNQFMGGDVAVKLERATGVTLIDNRATGTDGIVVVGPPVQAQYTDTGNDWPRPMQLQAP